MKRILRISLLRHKLKNQHSHFLVHGHSSRTMFVLHLMKGRGGGGPKIQNWTAFKHLNMEVWPWKKMAFDMGQVRGPWHKINPRLGGPWPHQIQVQSMVQPSDEFQEALAIAIARATPRLKWPQCSLMWSSRGIDGRIEWCRQGSSLKWALGQHDLVYTFNYLFMYRSSSHMHGKGWEGDTGLVFNLRMFVT